VLEVRIISKVLFFSNSLLLLICAFLFHFLLGLILYSNVRFLTTIVVQLTTSSNKEIIFLLESCSSFITFHSLSSTMTLLLIPVDSKYFKIVEMRAFLWNAQDLFEPFSN